MVKKSVVVVLVLCFLMSLSLVAGFVLDETTEQVIINDCSVGGCDCDSNGYVEDDYVYTDMTYDAVVPAYCESDPSSYPGALCDGQAGKWYNLILDDSTSEICALGQESDIETCAVYGCDCDGDGYVEDLHSYESGTAPGATAVGFCRLDPSNSNALCDDQVGEWYAGKSDSSNWGGSCTLGLQSEKPVENIYCKDNYDNDGDGAIDLYGGCDLDYDGIIDGNCSGAVDALACYSLCVNVGGIWYAPDSGCDVNNNASEYDRCGDGYDNDADGRIDYTGGCSTDGDLTIDYYCGCDEDRDGYVRPAEMRITKEDCSYDDGWGCNNARFDGPIAIELGRYQCEDGILYFPDEDCSGPGDDSERNYDLQSYVEGSSGTYQAPAFGESWIIKFWNFLFGS